MDPRKSFWETVPGILTAIGGTIGAVAALLTALYTTGIIGNRGAPANTPSPVATVQSLSPTPEPTSQKKPPTVTTVQSPSPEPEGPFQNTPPKGFYLIGTESKRRNDWARLGESTWIEKYDNGQTNEFRVSGRLAHNNCMGSLLYRVNAVDLEAFIPDKGCSDTRALWRYKNGEWASMGDMQDIQ
jgi:hypothetical protein